MPPINFQSEQHQSKHDSDDTTEQRKYDGKIYRPPVWNIGSSYVLRPFFKPNDKVRMKITLNTMILMTKFNSVYGKVTTNKPWETQ